MNFIPVNEPLLNGNEKKYLNECIDTGWISSEGPFVKKFEEMMAQKAGRKYGIAVANGSVALDAALLCLGLKNGDEVIMPTFTIISCASAIVRAGAKPILVDCDARTFNIKVEDIEAKITPKTKAIMIVHLYGHPVDVDPILALAKKHHLKVIEDAAEVHGQTYKGRPCGSFGDVSIFSFYPNKHITTGEGGMIVTDDPQINERCLSLRNLSHSAERRFYHTELGFNYRMTNLQAALGVAQVERLDTFVEKKREMGNRYNHLLKDFKNVILPLQKTEYSENIYWVYALVLKEEFPGNAESVMKALGKLGVGTRPFFYPMHLQPVFQNMGYYQNESYPNSEMIAERGFYLPSGLGLTEEQAVQVVAALKEVLHETI